MAERLEHYRCGDCAGKVIVLRGGIGAPQCCGHPMAIHAETPEEAEARRTMEQSAIPVRRCVSCGVSVLVIQPSKSIVRCCERAMELFDENASEAVAEKRAIIPPMEYNLTVPVKIVLDYIQQRLAFTTYFGIPILKNPLDFWVYQEIFFEQKPDVIVEIGNYAGGALLAYAHLLDHMGHGRLIGVDVQPHLLHEGVADHPRITLLAGYACDMYDEVRSLIKPGEKVMIIEDSLHTYENTLNVLHMYCGLVSPGCYFIVEDSNCHHGLDQGPFPGPYEAIVDFLKENPDFETDRTRESFFITWNPLGYLRRKSGA